MSLSKEREDENAFEKALNAYGKCLQTRPILTKAITSGSVSALGNFLSQLIVPNPENGGKVVWRSVAAYGAFGFVISGPVIHHLYLFLEKTFPKSKEESRLDRIKKVLLDRLVFTPPFILLFLYVVPILEGQGHAAAVAKIKETFWMILKMNWRVWTIFQFINLNYVPLKYRVLFGNSVALLWSIIVATQRRKMALK